MAAAQSLLGAIALWVAVHFVGGALLPQPPVCASPYPSTTPYWCCIAIANAVLQAGGVLILQQRQQKAADRQADRLPNATAWDIDLEGEVTEAHVSKSGVWGGWCLPYLLTTTTSLATAIVLGIAWGKELVAASHQADAPPSGAEPSPPPPPWPPLPPCAQLLPWSDPSFAIAATVSAGVLLPVVAFYVSIALRADKAELAVLREALRKQLVGTVQLGAAINIEDMVRPYTVSAIALENAAAAAADPGGV